MTNQSRTRRLGKCLAQDWIAISAILVGHWSISAVVAGQDRYYDALEKIREADNATLKRLEAERQVMLDRKEQLEDGLEKVRKVQGWATQDFSDARLASRHQLGGPKSNQRYYRIQQITAQQFVDLPPDVMAGGVRSGRGPNFFLRILGDHAIQHDQLINLHLNVPLDNVPDADRQRLLLIEALDRRLEIPPALSDIECLYGLGQQKTSVKLSNFQAPLTEVLPLDWPLVFHSEPRLARFRKPIEDARNQTILELEQGQIFGQGQSDLCKEISNLERDFARWREDQRIPVPAGSRDGDRVTPGRFDARRTADITSADTYITTLKCRVSKLIEMKALPKPLFTGGRVGIRFPNKRTLSLIQLLAQMRSNELEFAAASKASEVGYAQLIQKMVEYYQEMVAMRLMVTEQEQMVERSENEIEELAKFERQMMVMGKATDLMGLLMRPESSPERE